MSPSIFNRGDSDEEPEEVPPADPAEGVRLIGPDEAAEVVERGEAVPRRGQDTPRYGDRPDGPPPGPKPTLSFPLAEDAEPTQVERPRPAPVRTREDLEREEAERAGASEAPRPPDQAPAPRGGEPERLIDVEPASGEVELPHWTEPPTGEVPRVIVGDEPGVDDARWAAFADGPRWRDENERWAEDDDLTSHLAHDDESRVGALDDTERPATNEYLAFDDLDVPRSPSARQPASPPPAEPPISEPAASEPGPSDEPPDPAEPSAAGGRGTVRIESGRPRPGAPPAGRGPERPRQAAGGPGRGAPEARPRPGGQQRPARRAPARPEPSAAPGGGAGEGGGAAGGGAAGPRDVPLAVGVGVGIAAVALLLFWLGPGWVVALSMVILALCAVELFTALRRAGFSPPVLLGLVAVIALPWAAFARGEGAIPLVLFLFVAFGMIWYLAGVGRVRPTINLGVTALAVLWIGVLGSFLGLIVRIGPVGGSDVDQGVSLLLLAVFAAVFHDVGGFVVGSRFGRTPFSPISPNKTLEGLAGAVGVSLLAVLIVRYLFGVTTLDLGGVLAFGLACAAAAALGDLSESLVKRDLGIKDMGTILPGHGGVLDRFDTMLFVLPTAYFVIRFLYVG